MPEQKQVSRTENQNSQRMPIQPVSQSLERRQRLELAYGQGVDISKATSIEVSGPAMMQVMRSPPAIVRCEGEHAYGPPDPVIPLFPRHERTMSAIVLYNEHPEKEKT